MLTAKDIAVLARSTNVTNEESFKALIRAIETHGDERESAGESAAMEYALSNAAFEVRDAARAFTVSAERNARLLTDAVAHMASMSRVYPWHADDLIYQSNRAPSELAAMFDAAARSYNKLVDLYEVVGDAVRATPEEREVALAARRKVGPCRCRERRQGARKARRQAVG